LDDIHGQPELASITHNGAKEIVYSRPDGIRIFISPETGFLSRVERQTEAGVERGFELVSLETGSRPPDSEFERPAPGEGARDGSDEFRVEQDDRGFLASRMDLFATLARALDDGRLKWTDEMPAQVERVLLGLHQLHSTSELAGQVALGRGFVDKTATSLRDWLAQVDLSKRETLAEASEWVRKVRDDMEKNLKVLGDEFTAKQPIPGSCKQPLSGTCRVRPSLYEDLAMIEKRIQPEVYLEGMIKPVLATFDEKVAKQLEAK
jgi:hypothetical protein